MATKLTNTQKSSIQEQLNEGKGISDIAKDLKIPMSVVKAYLTDLFASLAKVKEINKKAAKDAAPKTVKDLMVTKTAEQKRKGVAIMTREASERSDEAKTLKGDGGLAFRQRYADTIYKIKEDEE
jgi:hypothetical protein